MMKINSLENVTFFIGTYSPTKFLCFDKKVNYTYLRETNQLIQPRVFQQCHKSQGLGASWKLVQCTTLQASNSFKEKSIPCMQ